VREKLLKAPEVAEITGLSPQLVRTMVKRGELPGAIYIGHHLRFDPEKLKAFFEAGGSRPRQGAEPDSQQGDETEWTVFDAARVRSLGAA
jgi:excisionase family DNA binding protein